MIRIENRGMIKVRLAADGDLRLRRDSLAQWNVEDGDDLGFYQQSCAFLLKELDHQEQIYANLSVELSSAAKDKGQPENAEHTQGEAPTAGKPEYTQESRAPWSSRETMTRLGEHANWILAMEETVEELKDRARKLEEEEDVTGRFCNELKKSSDEQLDWIKNLASRMEGLVERTEERHDRLCKLELRLDKLSACVFQQSAPLESAAEILGNELNTVKDRLSALEHAMELDGKVQRLPGFGYVSPSDCDEDALDRQAPSEAKKHQPGHAPTCNGNHGPGEMCSLAAERQMKPISYKQQDGRIRREYPGGTDDVPTCDECGRIATWKSESKQDEMHTCDHHIHYLTKHSRARVPSLYKERDQQEKEIWCRNTAQIMEQIHDNAKKHGFWPDGKADSECIALMHSELSEALEECRKTDSGGMRPASSKIPNFTGLTEELADTVIRIFDFAFARSLELPAAILAKMEYNKSRPMKHGKRF